MATRQKVRKSVYFNTMVFTIVAGVISLMLLVVLMLGPAWADDFAVLIVTIEAGLLLNIIYALYRIYRYESELKKMRERGLNNVIAVDSCPDYWTTEHDGVDGPKMCNPEAKTLMPDGTEITFKIGNEESPKKIGVADYDGQKLEKLCEQARNLKAPWTDIKVLCSAFNAWGEA